jgi:hypothetical protein
MKKSMLVRSGFGMLALCVAAGTVSGDCAKAVNWDSIYGVGPGSTCYYACSVQFGVCLAGSDSLTCTETNVTGSCSIGTTGYDEHGVLRCFPAGGTSTQSGTHATGAGICPPSGGGGGPDGD